MAIQMDLTDFGPAAEPVIMGMGPLPVPTLAGGAPVNAKGILAMLEFLPI